MSGSIQRRMLDDGLVSDLTMPDYRTSPTGDVLYVDNSGTFHGLKHRYETIAQALAKVTQEGSVIHVMPGHAETISAAGGINVNVANVTIVGHGSNGRRPTITFSATASTMLVSAANVRFINIEFVAGIADVVVGLPLTAASSGIEFHKCFFTGGAFCWTTTISLTACDDAVINGCRFNMNADAGTNIIDSPTASDRCIITNNWFDVSTTESCISGIWLQVTIDNNRLKNIGTGNNALIDMEATSTGFIDNNSGYSAGAIATAIAPNSCTMGDNNSVADTLGHIGAIRGVIGTVST